MTLSSFPTGASGSPGDTEDFSLPGTMGLHCFCKPPIYSCFGPSAQCAECCAPSPAGHTGLQSWLPCPWCYLCTWNPGAVPDHKHWGGSGWLLEHHACFAGISSSRSDLLLPSLLPAHQQRSHPRGEEGVCLPLAGLHTGAEALQGSVHVGGAHAKAHRREATQVHGELAGTRGASQLGKWDTGLWWSRKCMCRHRHGFKQGSPRVLLAPSSGPVQCSLSRL